MANKGVGKGAMGYGLNFCRISFVEIWWKFIIVKVKRGKGPIFFVGVHYQSFHRSTNFTKNFFKIFQIFFFI